MNIVTRIAFGFLLSRIGFASHDKIAGIEIPVKRESAFLTALKVYNKVQRAMIVLAIVIMGPLFFYKFVLFCLNDHPINFVRSLF